MANENIVKAIKEANIETLTQRIKDIPTYEVYKKMVEEKSEENTAKVLQMTVMLFSMFDKELSAMMDSVSLDLLFAMIDQKLRNEILQKSEGKE